MDEEFVAEQSEEHVTVYKSGYVGDMLPNIGRIVMRRSQGTSSLKNFLEFSSALGMII